MSMPISFAGRVGLFSMRRRIVRTVLSLIPCVLLIAVMFVGSTIPNGLVNELDNKVLKSAESRQELVTLDSYLFTQPDFTSFSAGGMMEASDNEFNKEKFNLATHAPQVAEVYPQIGRVDGQANSIGNVASTQVSLTGTSAEYAKLITPESFAFDPSQPIPLILNPSSIASQSYNWNGQTKLELDYSNSKDMETKQTYTTLKEADKLVGTVVTVEFGKFASYPEAFEEQSFGGFGAPKSKLTKLSDQDREILDKRIQEIYGTYWNVSKLKEPISLKFKIVGLLKGSSMQAGSSMVPNEAIPYIWNSVYQRQIAARTDKAMDKELLANEQAKVTVVDRKVPANSSFGYQSLTLQKDPSVSAWQVDISMVSVPGLLVESTKNAKGQNEYKEIDRTTLTAANFAETGAIVKLKSPDDREAYVKYLNDNNLQMYDQSPLAIIRGVRKWSNILVTWLTIILGAVVALILLTTVSRFVADSRKEIGVWRAIGATRLDIIKLVLVRMSLLLGFGILAGIVIGYGISYLLANSLASTFNTATEGFNPFTGPSGAGGIMSSIVIGLLGGNVPKLELAHLLATNWGLLLSRLGILSLITLVIGLIPALRASRISPVTAIRDSD